MLNFDAYQVLTFDCYGTLIDWEHGILGTLCPMLLAHNLHLSDAEILALYTVLEAQVETGVYCSYRSVLRQVLEGFGVKLGFVPTPEELASLAVALPHWQPFPDTVAALWALKRRYKLAVISNIDEDLFAATTQQLQVPFDWIITAERVRSYKPSRQNFTYAIEHIGVPPAQLLHVAQSLYHDIVPAKQLGLTAVWVNRYQLRPDATSQAQPDLEVPDLHTLVATMGLQ